MNQQIHCPVCGNIFVAEFYDPRGTALCLQCGATFRRLRDRLISLGNVEPDQITPDATFIDELKLNSLDVVELVMALEEEGVELTDVEAEEIKTMKDVVRLVNKRREK